MSVELKPVMVWEPGEIVKVRVAGLLVPEPFVAVTVTEAELMAVGVPLMIPEVVFKLKPAGKVPLANA